MTLFRHFLGDLRSFLGIAWAERRWIWASKSFQYIMRQREEQRKIGSVNIMSRERTHTGAQKSVC